MNVGATGDLLDRVCFLQATGIITHTQSTSQKDFEDLPIFISIHNTLYRDMTEDRLFAVFLEPANGQTNLHIYICGRF